jgi:hypothetical protein
MEDEPLEPMWAKDKVLHAPFAEDTARTTRDACNRGIATDEVEDLRFLCPLVDDRGHDSQEDFAITQAQIETLSSLHPDPYVVSEAISIYPEVILNRFRRPGGNEVRKLLERIIRYVARYHIDLHDREGQPLFINDTIARDCQ